MAFLNSFNETLSKIKKSSTIAKTISTGDDEPVTSFGKIAKSMTAYIPNSSNIKKEDNTVEQDRLIPASLMRKMYFFIAPVRACIDTIIREICSSKWDIVLTNPNANWTKQLKDKAKLITEKFQRPNYNNETFNTILESSLRDLLILDALTLEKVRDANGKFEELYALDASTIKIRVDDHKKLLEIGRAHV